MMAIHQHRHLIRFIMIVFAPARLIEMVAGYELCYSDTQSLNCMPCIEFADCIDHIEGYRSGKDAFPEDDALSMSRQEKWRAEFGEPRLLYPSTTRSLRCSTRLVAINGTHFGCECFTFWGFYGRDCAETANILERAFGSCMSCPNVVPSCRLPLQIGKSEWHLNRSLLKTRLIVSWK